VKSSEVRKESISHVNEVKFLVTYEETLLNSSLTGLGRLDQSPRHQVFAAAIVVLAESPVAVFLWRDATTSQAIGNVPS
jgi:hypothetical protein